MSGKRFGYKKSRYATKTKEFIARRYARQNKKPLFKGYMETIPEEFSHLCTEEDDEYVESKELAELRAKMAKRGSVGFEQIYHQQKRKVRRVKE